MGHHHRLAAPLQSTTPTKTLQDVKDQHFDYIVIGGGTAGCLLASRLAAAPNKPPLSVLLVEAGGETSEDPDNLIPGLTVPKFGSEEGNWLYETTPQKQLNDRTIVYPRGRGMGGSSTNNFSSWVRGPKCDWDDWAELVGDEWWRWDNVVEYMKQLEDFHEECPENMKKYVKPAEGMHHRGGPIGVGNGREWQGLLEHCLKGAVEAGHALNLDHNDGDEMGVAVAQMNVDRGVRRNAADAFLGPKSREKLENLLIVSRSICKRVVFEGKRAVSVELLLAEPTEDEFDEPVSVHIDKEVILAAGTFETPHILLLSGVGPAAELGDHNINVVHDLPFVGKNIQDHCAFSIEAAIDPLIAGHNQLLKNEAAMAAARRQYNKDHTGPLAVFGASAAVLFARLPELYESQEFRALPQDLQTFLANPNRPSTELWLHGGPLFYTGQTEIDDSIIAIEGLCQNLLSKGSLRLKSNDPRTPPLVDPAYCAEAYDWRVTIETIKLQLRLVNTPAMQAIIRKVLHGPGAKQSDGSILLCDPGDEVAIRKFLQETLTQGFHSMSSCVMGREQNTARVVDSELKVLGLENVRISDMAVCPILTNNHTQINAYLIGERCAQAILGDGGEAGYGGST